MADFTSKFLNFNTGFIEHLLIGRHDWSLLTRSLKSSQHLIAISTN
jgi:hypothetical protein